MAGLSTSDLNKVLSQSTMDRYLARKNDAELSEMNEAMKIKRARKLKDEEDAEKRRALAKEKSDLVNAKLENRRKFASGEAEDLKPESDFEVSEDAGENITTKDLLEGKEFLDGAQVQEIEIPEMEADSDTPATTPAPQVGSFSATFNGGANVGGLEAEKRANTRIGDLSAAQSDQMADMMEQNNKRIALNEERMELARQEEQKYLAEQRSKIDKKQAEYNRKPANISQLFKEKSTGGKMGIIISLFLGSSPNSSGQNTAVKALTDSIESDLDKQQNEIDGQETLYSTMREKVGDDEVARLATHETILQQVQREIDIQAQKFQAPQIKEQAKLANAKLQQSIDAIRNEMAIKMAQASQKMNHWDKLEMENFQKSMEGKDGAKVSHVDKVVRLLVSKKVNTGPLAKRFNAVKRFLGSASAQSLKYSLQNIGLERIAAFAGEAGARAIDSDQERKYLEQALVNEGMTEEVLMKILLVAKSVQDRRDIRDAAMAQWYRSGNTSLDGFVDPTDGKRPIYNVASGHVDFIREGANIPDGFVTIKDM